MHAAAWEPCTGSGDSYPASSEGKPPRRGSRARRGDRLFVARSRSGRGPELREFVTTRFDPPVRRTSSPKTRRADEFLAIRPSYLRRPGEVIAHETVDPEGMDVTGWLCRGR